MNDNKVTVSNRKPYEDRFKVQAEITKHPETGEPLFNGVSRDKITAYPLSRKK